MLTAEIAALQPRSGYDFGFVLRPGADEAATDDGAAATRPPVGARASARRGRPPMPKCGRSSSSSRRPTPARAGTPAPTRRSQPAPSDRGGFAYWASPSNPGVTGNRRFCVDETGVVREYGLDAAWTAPSDDQPRCPDTGRPLQ